VPGIYEGKGRAIGVETMETRVAVVEQCHVWRAMRGGL